MLRFAHWAVLAMAPLAQARFDWLHARHNAEECCPCPAPGAPEDYTKTVTVSEPAGTAHTVTVTEPQGAPSKETVTIEHLVTNPGKTVYVTRTEEHVVTKVMTVVHSQLYMQPSAKTVAITPGSPHPSAVEPEGNYYEVVTKTVPVSGDKYKVVTVTLGGGGEHVKTITLGNSRETGRVVTIGNSNKHTVTIGDSDKHIVTKTIQEGGKYYTVTVGDSSKHTVTIGDPDQHIITKTIQEDGKYYTITVGDSDKHVTTKTIQEDGKHYTVIVKPTSSVQTITLEGGKETTKVVDVPCTITVTAPPQDATATQHLETLTTTVTDSYGQPDVEIIIIDTETGKSTCKKKESGHPCKNSYEYPEGPGGYVVTMTDGESATTVEEGYIVTATDGSVATVTEGGFVTTVKQGGYIVTVTGGSGAAETGCPSMAVSTSIQTVYNTVLVTVGPGGSAAPKPTGKTATDVEQSMSRQDIRDRQQRSPRSVQW
ncbi:hypothetical protein QQZ08_003975 [Neonectria magnoliae]|uniref:Uncharacterized protein n=1 Tax=Neonectria magnoliae TaxID=2732573 RepID=A0ABR1I708_9HYPO